MTLSTSPPLPAGRPRQAANRDLLPRLKRRKSGNGHLYYYIHADGYQEPLGSDYRAAVEAWKVLHFPGDDNAPNGFRKLSEAWEKSEAFAILSSKTQYDYGLAMNRWRDVFKSAPLERIGHAAIVATKREMKAAPTQFKRFKSALSSFWTWAEDEEHTESPNPCVGVKGYKTKKRGKVKVTNAMYFAVYDQAAQPLRDWMDLAVVCGPRVMDCCKLKRTDIEGGKLHVTHGKKKTGTELPIVDDLKVVIDRLRDRKVSSIYLVADEAGQPITYSMLRTMFDEAMELAVKKDPEMPRWQRRDLRGRNATDADTLQEAQERLGHDDPRTTATFYRQAMKAKPGRLPRR